jgi:signal transduction histidine kinase
LSSNPPEQPPADDILMALNRSSTANRLLSSAVHDVNNALQVISGTVELLESRPGLDEAMARALDRVRTQSARAAAALADVLAYTKAPLEESAPVNLRDTAAHAVALRTFAARRTGVTIRLLADQSTPFVVRGSRGQIEQALLNLLLNAEQSVASTRGTILVELTADADWITVRVIDDGGGIDVAPQERVFDRFVSTRPHEDAAGLGLWAARRIAEAHGGTLGLEEGGARTTFVLKLPRLDYATP